VSKPAPRVLIDYLTLAADHLGGKGVGGARLDAELLLAGVLGMSRVELYTNYDRPLAKDEVDRFRDVLRRRAMREPVAYILGRREFWSLELEVDRRVLIPRPETETLVEAALKALRALRPTGDNGFRVLDVGTGSGAIAVALAVESPQTRVVATDVTAAALEVAPRNAARHGVADRIEFRQGDLFDALAPGEVFDLMVSNPPYCKASELREMDPEVREWEPTGALVSGPEGMDVTARLVARAPQFLRQDGFLLLEVGTQAAAARDLLARNDWQEIRLLTDLAGRSRVLVGRPPVV
jgi:release factor glutamine methyltransferase